MGWSRVQSKELLHQFTEECEFRESIAPHDVVHGIPVVREICYRQQLPLAIRTEAYSVQGYQIERDKRSKGYSALGRMFPLL